MISECLADIDKPTDIGSFYELDYPNIMEMFAFHEVHISGKTAPKCDEAEKTVFNR